MKKISLSLVLLSLSICCAAEEKLNEEQQFDPDSVWVAVFESDLEGCLQAGAAAADQAATPQGEDDGEFEEVDATRLTPEPRASSFVLIDMTGLREDEGADYNLTDLEHGTTNPSAGDFSAEAEQLISFLHRVGAALRNAPRLDRTGLGVPNGNIDDSNEEYFSQRSIERHLKAFLASSKSRKS